MPVVTRIDSRTTTVTNLGLLNRAITRQERVGGSNLYDTYQIRLGARSRLQLSLSGLRANANLELLSAQGAIIAASRRGGTLAESLQVTLNGGNYLVRVRSGDRRLSPYTLRLTPTALSQSFTFTYRFGNGEFYSGTGIASGGTYRQGQTLVDTNTNEVGYRGSYLISSVQDITYQPSLHGRISVNRYYDAETHQTYTPLMGSGTGGLGSEAGYIQDWTSLGYFGWRYYAADIPLGVDLRPTSLDVVPTTSNAGDTVTVRYTLSNLQPGAAQNFQVGLYLSTDSTISTGDRLLGSATFSSFSGYGSSGLITQNLTLPESSDAIWTGNSTYYIGLITDDTNVISETNESNNSNLGLLVSHDSLTVSPSSGYQYYTYRYRYGNGDYYDGFGYATAGQYSTNQTINNSSPNEIGLYGSYQITSTTHYTGSSNSIGTLSVTGYYDSESGQLRTVSNGSGSAGLGSEAGTLMAGESITQFGNGYTEADLPIRQYTFQYLYDGTYEYPSTASEDFYSGSVYAYDGTYSWNGYFDPVSSANETGRNGRYYILGYSTAGSTTDLGKVYVTGYHNGETNSTIAPYSGYGSNYLGSEYGYLTSTQTSANDLFGYDYYEADTVAATIDLQGYSLDVPATLTAGSSFTATFRIQNTGNASAGNFRVSFYLSQDATITTGDRLLGTYDVTSLAAGSITTTLSKTLSLPGSGDGFWTGNGTYSVGIYVDALSAIAESNEANNINQGLGYDRDTTTITVSTDWFTSNLNDLGLRETARSLFTDNSLSRTDMISIFENARDGSVIDGTELTDLRTLVANTSTIIMPDPVRVLSNKVANNHVANAIYQGISLGNLYAGSSSTQMDNLLNKWFRGSDRPLATSAYYTYEYASGSLFQNGISYQDVFQGSVGDCYYLAGLANTALHSAATIESMFIDNGDNTYTVRFFQGDGSADYVTVDRYLPSNGGQFVYAHQNDPYWGSLSNTANELWVALAEKAYAQMSEAGWLSGPSNSFGNAYDSIESGYGGGAIEDLTGRNTVYDSIDLSDFNTIVTTFNAGQWVYLGSRSSVASSSIVSNHGYIMVGYNATTQLFNLFNPWGINGGTSNGVFKPGLVELSMTDLVNNFNGWYRTTA